MVELLKGASAGVVDGFLHHEFELPDGRSLSEPDGVVLLLQHLRGDARINDLAQALGCSRFVMTRWLKRTTELPLPALLSFIEATTLRLLEFLATLVDPARLPSVGQRWLLLEASRRAAYEHPWSHAVLRVLETRAYQEQRRHRRGFIADRIGISVPWSAKRHAGQALIPTTCFRSPKQTISACSNFTKRSSATCVADCRLRA